MALRALVLTLLAGILSGCSPTEQPLAPPHGIVLIGLDTLRADRLSAYGHERATSSALDRLAAEGVLFENAMSPAAWTLPGFAAILTGRPFTRRIFGPRLLISLVEEFQRAGFATAGFTEGGYVSEWFGFNRGFDKYWEGKWTKDLSEDTGAVHTFGLAQKWLRENAEEPFFLFVHTYEVHTPYRTRRFAEGLPSGVVGEIYDHKTSMSVIRGALPVGETEIAYVRALYDGGVAEADRRVGELLETLDSLGIADRTIVAVTSDHGEALSERAPQELGRHGHGLYDALLHVPLILRDPRREWPIRRISAQVRTLDVMPTLLDLAGIEVPPDVEGRSLVPLMTGAETADRVAYSELLFRKSKRGSRVKQSAVRMEGAKLIANDPSLDAPSLELYDLAEDPDERVNLAEERPELRSRLYFLLQEERRRRDAERRPESSELRTEDEGLQERLRALGYVP